MTPQRSTPVRPASPPRAEALSQEALERLRRGAERVSAELRRFIGALPPQARSASGMARFLEIDRTTCQRAVWVSARAEVGPELLTRLPGDRAMRELARAARGRGVEEAAVGGLESAILHVRELLAEIAGSREKLAQRLSAGAAPGLSDGHGAAQEAARGALCDAAAVITGRRSRVSLSLYIFRPAEHDPAKMSRGVVHGFLDHESRPDAVPLVINSGRRALSIPDGRFELRTLDQGSVQGVAPGVVLTDFSTRPLPVVTSRGPGGDHVQIIDAAAASEEPVDVLVANYAAEVGAHPAADSPPIEEVWHLLYYPARHLLFDVYLHRDMARMCIPNVEAHLWRPHFDKALGERWDTRLPEGPRLELLGPGIRRSATPLHARHAELTALLFERLGFCPDEYVGYRCQVEHPVWRAGYCMSFDFTGAPVATEPPRPT
jgi:hypothetical protein